MKYIIVTVVACIVLSLVVGNIITNYPVSEAKISSSYLDLKIDGDVQMFEYKNITCFTWKQYYSGGLSCVPTSEIIK